MIHIVTDSTSDLTPEVLAAHFGGAKIHVIPLTVHFGEEEYRDGVDLTTAEFYRKLTSGGAMPRTSQPSPAAFVDLYKEISQPGDVILSYHLSARLSGTIQSAALAARQIEDRTIEVIDTRSVSMGLALIAGRAAERAASGATPEEIVQESRELIAKQHIYFVVDTLEYLQRNGRIGKAQALVGGLLNVKPILTLDDGVVAPLEKVRGRSKARERLFERASSHAATGGATMGAVLQAAAAEDAKAFADRLHEAYGIRFPVIELGPTVGTHAGPGTLGVVVFAR